MRLFKFLHLSFLLLIIISCDDNVELQPSNKMVSLGLLSESENNARTEAIVIQPGTGTFYAGQTMVIQWGFLTCLCNDWISDFIHIELYKGSTFVATIARNVPFFDANNQSYYNWLIPSVPQIGNDFNIRIVNASKVNQIGYSSEFTLTTQAGTCNYSFWSLSGMPSGYISSGSTVNYNINETGQTILAQANSPTMKVFSYDPINVVYNGLNYYCPGSSGVLIPINGSMNCSGNNPVISAPLKFNKIGSGTSVIVTLNSVSTNHIFSSGYHSYSVY